VISNINLMIQIFDIDATQIVKNINGKMIVESAKKIVDLVTVLPSICVCLAMMQIMIYTTLDIDVSKSVEMENKWVTMNVMMET